MKPMTIYVWSAQAPEWDWCIVVNYVMQYITTNASPDLMTTNKDSALAFIFACNAVSRPWSFGFAGRVLQGHKPLQGAQWF